MTLLLLWLLAGALEPTTVAGCWPGEPGSDPTLCPPNDPGYSRRWEFRSDIPDSVDEKKMHPAERALGSIGISLDRAWQRTTGRDDVLIAVLDSGIIWGKRDLVHKLYLNAGELPPPHGSKVHDANGDGVFDIRDYDGDPRVGDRNGTGFLDPEDLIRTFSDCRDDDGNGYVDDISGYDFFAGEHCGFKGADNNPTDEISFGHGSAIAETAAAETNNGIDDAGVCPRCRVLPVRIGDTFVVDGNQFARGTVFAAISGASVIASAVGSYNNTPAARAAVDFAYERKTAIIGSAADEYAYHHNYPSVYNHVLYVNAIQFNHARDYRKATTFWGLNSCTNFGARVWVTVPARNCSSGATSRLAGVSGLLHSAARDAGLGELHPEELYQVLRATADDLDNSKPDWSKVRFPAKPGFDQIYGYGRINAHRAVSAVLDSDVPPIADLADPDWFAVVSPTKQPRIPIAGTARVTRTATGRYSLEYALGVEPTEAEYLVVSSEEFEGQASGHLGTLDFSKLPRPAGPAPTNRAERDRYSVTLRLSVTDESGRRAEARRSFFVLDDPDWMRHFPARLEASGEAGPVLADLDGDGRDEIVLPTADGVVRFIRWTEQGLVVTRAPLDEAIAEPPAARATPLRAAEHRRETVIRSAAVGDLSGNGEPVVVVASREGKIYAFDRRGARIAPFPVSIDPALAAAPNPGRVVERGVLTRPVLADVDGRPGLEIIVTALDGHVHVWRHDGSPLDGFPVRAENVSHVAGRQSKIVSTPAVGDIDGDGLPEILFGTNAAQASLAAVYAVRPQGRRHPEGALLPGWDPFVLPAIRPDLLPLLAHGVHMTPGLADTDGDGDLEVALYAVTGTSVMLVDQQAAGPKIVARYSLAPGPNSGIEGTSFLGGTGSPLVADTDADGVFELYAPLLPFRMLTLRTKPGVPLEVPLALGGWELTNRRGSRPQPMMSHWPRRMEDLMLLARPIATDLDGDGIGEVVMGSGGYLLHAFDREGGEAPGFPKFTGGWVFSAPAAGDLDGDGRDELVAVTREGYLFAWKPALRIPSDRSPGAGPSD